MQRVQNGPAPQRSIPAVVLGGEHGSLPIIRSLARGGIASAIVASERADDSTFHSRYCALSVVMERFDAENDGRNLASLVSIAKSMGERPVLFWCSDREILFVNRNREELGRWYRFVMADSALIDALVDKGRFAAYATERGLPVPATFIFTSAAEILNRREELPYPCLIKPVHMFSWNTESVAKTFGTYKHALRRLEGPGELESYLRLLPNIDHGVVIQQFIEGRDEDVFSFHAYFDETGEARAGFIGRKIRTNPIHFGGSAYIETVHRPDLMKLCIAACSTLGFRGIVKIDCKRDAATGRFFILEFNPRFNLWEYLGAFAGVNLPAIWYDDLAGSGRRTEFSYRAGMRWLYVAGDLRAYTAYSRAGEWTAGKWIGSYLAPKVYHTFAWRDPAPLLYAIPAFLRRKARRWRLKHQVVSPSQPVSAAQPVSTAQPVSATAQPSSAAAQSAPNGPAAPAATTAVDASPGIE